MATRATFLSPAHVEALNAVPIEFYGNKKIIDPWKEYLDYLSQLGIPPDVWLQRRIELFVSLLDVKSFPIEAHALEEQQDLRRLLLKWPGGEQSVKVDLRSNPPA